MVRRILLNVDDEDFNKVEVEKKKFSSWEKFFMWMFRRCYEVKNE